MADCRFESLVADLLNRTKQPCKDCMKDAGISSGDISEVLLVGGQTRMPKVSSQGRGIQFISVLGTCKCHTSEVDPPQRLYFVAPSFCAEI